MAKLIKKCDIPILEKVLIVAIPSEKKLQNIREKTWINEINFDDYAFAMQDPKNQNFIAMFTERTPVTIVEGNVSVAGESFIADIIVTANHGKLRFAKVVKRYNTEIISKEDLIKFSKENEDFRSMFRCGWRDVIDNFSSWKLLPNAIFGVKEVWNDCGAFQNFVFYKVDGKVSAIRVALAEGRTQRRDEYSKENVGEILFTVKSEDVITPSVHIAFNKAGDVVKTTKLKMSFDERILQQEIIFPEWSVEEMTVGGQFYSTDSDGIWFEVPSLNLKPNTTFGSKAFICERPTGFPNPQGMEIDKCSMVCTVQYLKIDNRESFVEQNYLYKIKILNYGEPIFRNSISGYSSYGDAENRRNGVDS